MIIETIKEYLYPQWFRDLFYAVKHYKSDKRETINNINDINEKITWLETRLSNTNNVKQDKK